MALYSEFQMSLRRYKDLNVKKGIKKQNRSDDVNFIHTNIDDFFCRRSVPQILKT